MTNQTKRKGKTKMKTYEVNQEVMFQGEQYKVVELLSEGTLVHLKKVETPFNTMVVPAYKIGEKDYAEHVKSEVLDSEGKFDLRYRPDDRITLSVEISPEVMTILKNTNDAEEQDGC